MPRRRSIIDNSSVGGIRRSRRMHAADIGIADVAADIIFVVVVVVVVVVDGGSLALAQEYQQAILLVLLDSLVVMGRRATAVRLVVMVDVVFSIEYLSRYRSMLVDGCTDVTSSVWPS